MNLEERILDAMEFDDVMDTFWAIGHLWQDHELGSKIVEAKVDSLLPPIDWETAPLSKQQDWVGLKLSIVRRIMERIRNVDLQPDPDKQPWSIMEVAEEFCKHLTKEQFDGWCEVEKSFDELIEHKGDIG